MPHTHKIRLVEAQVVDVIEALAVAQQNLNDQAQSSKDTSQIRQLREQAQAMAETSFAVREGLEKSRNKHSQKERMISMNRKRRQDEDENGPISLP